MDISGLECWWEYLETMVATVPLGLDGYTAQHANIVKLFYDHALLQYRMCCCCLWCMSTEQLHGHQARCSAGLRRTFSSCGGQREGGRLTLADQVWTSSSGLHGKRFWSCWAGSAWVS